MSVWLPVIVVVMGWLATHILTLRAQQNNLRNQIIDRARLEIVDALRAYQEWLQQTMASLYSLKGDVNLERELVPIDWFARVKQLGAAMQSGDATYRWHLRLDEYEVLFPETKAVASALSARQQQLSQQLGALQIKLGSIAMASINVPIDKSEMAAAASTGIEATADQIGLTEDLRIWLQNKTLGRLMGRKVPQREPTDPSLPRIVPAKRGILLLVERRNEQSADGASANPLVTPADSHGQA